MFDKHRLLRNTNSFTLNLLIIKEILPKPEQALSTLNSNTLQPLQQAHFKYDKLRDSPTTYNLSYYL